MTVFNKAWGVVKSMDDYQKLEYVHFAIQEAMNGNLDELQHAIGMLEDVREAYLRSMGYYEFERGDSE